MMRRWLFPSMLVLASAATLDSVGGSELPAPGIDGTWARAGAPRGCRTTITLASRREAVTGAGTYVGEGGHAGTVTVAGTWQDGRADLTMHYSDGAVGRFVGAAVGADQISGLLAFDGGAITEAAFTRQ